MAQIKTREGLRRAELKLDKVTHYPHKQKRYKRLVKLINAAYRKGL